MKQKKMGCGILPHPTVTPYAHHRVMKCMWRVTLTYIKHSTEINMTRIIIHRKTKNMNVHKQVCFFVILFVLMFVCLFVGLFVCLFECLFLYLFLAFFMNVSTCFYFEFIYLFTYLYIYLFLNRIT